MRRYGTVNIFGEQELSKFLDSLHAELKATVHGETAEYLLNTNEDEYTHHLQSKFGVEPLQIHFDEVWASSREEQIAGERHPSSNFDSDRMRGRSFRRQVIRYHIPYQGTEDLLRCIPNPRVVWTSAAQLEDGHISFDIIDFYVDPERIKSEANQIIGNMKRQLENVTKNVATYNNQLPGLIKKTIADRKEELRKQIGVVASLGVPIRKSPHVPETFRVPDVRKKIVPRPAVPPGVGKPEPVLGEDIYQEILQVIHDTGKVFERLPSTYADKDEEALRDHLILQLEPRFEGSTTGETFNKSGKTDILIGHEKSNIFVAECKYWDGKKKHLETIDQLLGYLTWRDSKTAVICFVDRRDFTNALAELDAATREHPCFLRCSGAKEATWLDFEFHLPSDRDRKVQMAVLAFHLPRQ